MSGSRKTVEVMDYRLGQVEKAVEQIGKALDGIDKSLNALASLEQRHSGIEESVSRAFKRIEEVEVESRNRDAKVDAVDGEFKKWFNRGVGVAVVVSFLGTCFGGVLSYQIISINNAVKEVPQLTSELRTTQNRLKVVMKKMGFDVVE